jgi:hypothetical protein
MTPIDYFYKVGQQEALLELSKALVDGQDFDPNMPLKKFLGMYPRHMRSAIGDILKEPDQNLVKDRATWFANNFLKNTGRLDRKLLRYALKQGVGEVEGTLQEGAGALLPIGGK